jgi:predicted peroxiredoxin
MQVLYFATAGTADPTQTSIPWHLAVNGSVEAGQRPIVVLGGDAAEILVGDAIETTEGVGLPPLRELVAKAREHEVPVYI